MLPHSVTTSPGRGTACLWRATHSSSCYATANIANHGIWGILPNDVWRVNPHGALSVQARDTKA